MDIELSAKLLQFSISPIALISGASLMMLSLTNRFGRTIDRSRILVREIESTPEGSFHEEIKTQLRILSRRADYLRSAILLIAASIFLSALMIMGVVAQIFGGWNLQFFVLGCLSLGVLAIAGSVVFLFVDVSAGLHALNLEIKRYI